MSYLFYKKGNLGNIIKSGYDLALQKRRGEDNIDRRDLENTQLVENILPKQEAE